MDKIKILIVEDDPYLGMMVKECFEDRGFEAHHYGDGKSGFTAYCELNPDVCILDVMMPFKDGFSLAKEIRSLNKTVPIIFTTAKSMKADVLEGFNAGADDYVKKPFSMEELIARVNAILRRSNFKTTDKKETIFKLGKYTFDHKYLSLKFETTEKKLSQKEADLLKLFCENLNETIERGVILQKIWGDDNFFNGRSMDVFITKIRKYLREETSIEIVNVRGIGYKLLLDKS